MRRRQGSPWKTSLVLSALAVMSCSEQPTTPAAGGPGIAPSAASAADRRPAKLVARPSTLDWQEEARTLVGANNLSPLAAGRVFAALSVAQYQGVVAAGDRDDDRDRDGLLRDHGLRRGGRSSREAARGAVAGASAEVLSFFFPAAAPTLEQHVLTDASAGPGNHVHPAFTRALAIGRSVGDAMVVRAKTDHFTAPFTGTIPTGPGLWIPAPNVPPAGATLSGVTPYLLTSSSQFRPAQPPTFGSSEYLADLHEIRMISDTRTPDQIASANQWNYPTGTFTPAGFWNLTAATYVEADRLDELAATHAFALMHAAMMDAFIGCFDAKYTYFRIRPSQADPAIHLVFALPNHPSYPSAHSCISAAAATVLGHIFPERQAEVTDDMVQAGLSRMYAGIHYRTDISAGQTLGSSVGQLAIRLDKNPGLLAAIK
jgi:membrane-associated phospholipid phosphatase